MPLRAFGTFLQTLATEITILRDAQRVSDELVDQLQNATEAELRQYYNRYRNLRPLDNNANLPVTRVLQLIPDPLAHDHQDLQALLDLLEAQLPTHDIDTNVAYVNIPDLGAPEEDGDGGNDNEDVGNLHPPPPVAPDQPPPAPPGPPGPPGLPGDGQGLPMAAADGARRLKFSELLPSVFAGLPTENARHHFQKYRDYVRVHGLNDAEALERFTLTLTDLPREWIKNRVFVDLNALEKAFLSQYSLYKSREAVIRALSQMKYTPGISMDKYLANIRELADRVEQNDEQIRDYFVNGLPDAMRSGLLLHNFTGLDDLVDKAQKFLELNPNVIAKQVTFMAHDCLEDMTSLALVVQDLQNKVQTMSQPALPTSTTVETKKTESEETRRSRPSSSERSRTYGNGEDRSPRRYRDDSRSRDRYIIPPRRNEYYHRGNQNYRRTWQGPRQYNQYNNNNTRYRNDYNSGFSSRGSYNQQSNRGYYGNRGFNSQRQRFPQYRGNNNRGGYSNTTRGNQNNYTASRNSPQPF